MMYAWRVIKNATHKDYAYVAIEFDMTVGVPKKIRVKADSTSVRKRSTTEFEILENDEWMTIPYKEVPSLMKEFNQLRKKFALDPITADDVLVMLYQLDKMKRRKI